MGRLTLNLLGAPEVLHDGRPLSFRTQKALALLLYLAMEEGMHPREKLATLFWPESDRKAGRATLRTTLLYLRRSLEHEQAETSHLIVERSALGFNAESDYEIDVEVLEAAAEMTAGEAELDVLHRAARRYRADFLEGFSLPDAAAFDEWTSFEREHWHRRMNDVMERLSRRQEDGGQIEAAMETVSRWLALDAYREPAYRRLMRLHFLAGNRSAALRTYAACREVLAEELGASPSPETAALAERIRTEAPPRPEPAPQDTATTPFSTLPLVGRAGEHGRLVAAYRRVRQGTAQILTVEGEAGIGKTRLADEFLAWATAQGADVARSKAFESGGRLSYQPVITALRQCIGQYEAPGDLLGDVWLAELSRILPEIRDHTSDLSPLSGDESTAQARLFEAVSRLGQALAEERPLVLFIDDLQWADAGSLDLLQVVCRRWVQSDAPILLLLGIRAEALARPGPDAAGAGLRQWLSGLEQDVSLTRVTLDPLTAAETRELVQALSPQSSENEEDVRAFSRWLFEETQGHPFYIAETITALLERGVLAVRGDDESAPILDVSAAVDHPAILRSGEEAGFIAPGVREVIRDRLSRLSPTAFELLGAGAVLGYDVRLRTLCRVADVTLAEALPALDELLSARLLVEEGRADESAATPYHFAHDKIRDVVYTEVGDARRHLFHERAFRHLEDRGANASRLAHHARAANLLEAAFRYSLEAGEEAGEVFAVRSAIGHYERARQLLAEHPQLEKALTIEQRRRLYRQLGRAYELENEWEPARQLYQEMLSAARSAAWPQMEVAALNQLADLAIQAGFDVDTARVYLSQATEIAEQVDDRPGLARAEWCMAQVTMYTFAREEAMAHGERALALARDVGDEALIARSLNALSYAKHGAVSPSLLREAEEHAREARAWFVRLGNRAMEVDSLNMVAATKIHAGRPRVAQRVARQAQEMAVAIENEWGQANTGFNLAQALFEGGRWGQALSTVQEAVAIAEEHELPMLPTILLVRGSMYREFNAVEKALADHERARRLYKSFPNPAFAVVTAVDLCADYAAAGRWQQACGFAQETRDTEGWSWLFGAFHYWRVVEAFLQEGDVAHARAAVQDFDERVGDNPRYAIPHRRSLALLAQEEGRPEEAAAHLETAVAAARRLDLPGELRSLTKALGVLYEELGDAAKARTMRERAEGLCQTLAATLPEDVRAGFVEAA